jgi:glycosyltransferase involved in cell wall biosynthesis
MRFLYGSLVNRRVGRNVFANELSAVNNTMRILQVYNEYRTYGGEDTVVHLEADMLRQHGHQVELLRVSTKELDEAELLRLVAAWFGTAWSFRGYSMMKKAIARFSPNMVHVHNTFPLLSPSVFWAADRAGVPVVQTLHNYRLTCANSLLLREDRPCQECVGHFPWSALRHRCFGSSFLRTAAVTGTNVIHRWLGTYRSKVHAFIVLTEFSREILVRAGLPRERIHVKPNFSPPLVSLTSPRVRRFVFAGIIARFKGVHLLLEAWARVASAGHQLLIVGDGPDRMGLERRFAAQANIVWHGKQSRQEVMDLIAGSRWLVSPSLAYENFPMSVLEALSAGTPVIVPNHGAFNSIVSDGVEGLAFSAGDADSLATALQAALDASEGAWIQWSANARNKHVSAYSASTNYAQLMSIYREAMESFQRTRVRAHSPEIAEAAGPIAKEHVREH